MGFKTFWTRITKRKGLLLAAISVVVTWSSRFLDWGTRIIDWMERYQQIREKHGVLFDVLHWVFSPAGSNLMTGLAIVVFLTVVILAVNAEPATPKQQHDLPLSEKSSQTERPIQTQDDAPQLEPNIVAETPELLSVNQREIGGVIVEGVERGREADTMLARVVPYRNLVTAGKPIGVARNITGRAVYRRYGDTTAIGKERIAWLSEDRPRVFFERNDVRRLILAMQNVSGGVFIVQRDVSGTGHETRYTLLDDGLYSVRVTLMNEVDSSVKNRSEFILEVQHAPNAIVTLQEANLWRASKLRDFHDKLSLLFDSFKLQLTANDPPGAAETLANVIDREMLKCKEFVADQFEHYKARKLGLTLSQYRDLPPLNKRLTPPPNVQKQISNFLDALNELRRTG